MRSDSGVARRSVRSEPGNITTGGRGVRIKVGECAGCVTLSLRDRSVDGRLLGRRATAEGCTLLERRLAPGNCERARDAGRVAIGHVGVDGGNGGILINDIEEVVSVDVVHASTRGGEIVGLMNWARYQHKSSTKKVNVTHGRARQ